MTWTWQVPYFFAVLTHSKGYAIRSQEERVHLEHTPQAKILTLVRSVVLPGCQPIPGYIKLTLSRIPPMSQFGKSHIFPTNLRDWPAGVIFPNYCIYQSQMLKMAYSLWRCNVNGWTRAVLGVPWKVMILAAWGFHPPASDVDKETVTLTVYVEANMHVFGNVRGSWST